MKITRVSTAVVAGHFPWVLVKIEGIAGLGEAYWGVDMTLNEEIVSEPLQLGSSFFGDSPQA